MMDATKARFAYRLWEARGRPEGSPDVDWFEAERRMKYPGGASLADAVPDVVRGSAAETSEAKSETSGDSLVLPAEGI